MILTVVINLIAFIFVLGVLVIIHEAGHFLMARAVGAPVEVFSVGFGRRLWGFERGGTDYRVSLVPLGGYVRIVGLGPDESDVVGHGSETVALLPRWKRALILLAGPLTNVVGAVLFLAVAFMVGVESPAYLDQPPVVGWVEPEAPAAAAGVVPGDHIHRVDGQAIESWRDLDMAIATVGGGREIAVELERDGVRRELRFTPGSVTRYGLGYSGILPPLDARIEQLIPGSPAARAGLQPGDRITAVNGAPVVQFYDLIRLISPHPGEEVTLAFVRDGAPRELKLMTMADGDEGRIGVALVYPTVARQLGPLAAVAAASDECRRMTADTFRVIGRLFRGKTSIKQVSGPLDIARISGDAARSGLHTLVWFMGLISLQLGIFNLLPIPILDGGHLTILAFESTIRRDLSIKVKERILEVGFYALMALMVVVLFNDIVKTIPQSVLDLFGGGS